MRLPAIACIHAKAVQTAGINKKRVRAMDHRKGLRIGLTVLSILGALMAVPLVMFSPMIFDAPGSDENNLTWFLFFAVLAFPVLCLMGGILPWILKNHPKSLWLYGLGVIGFVLITVAVILLETQCQGSFSC